MTARSIVTVSVTFTRAPQSNRIQCIDPHSTQTQATATSTATATATAAAPMPLLFPTTSLSPADLLLSSFLLQILFTTLLGWVMLLPRQPWAKDHALATKLRSRDVTSAHVDWVMLALVQLGAAVVLPRCQARLAASPHTIAWCLIYNGWAAPFVYFLKAFGINGFRATGKLSVESLVGLMGFSSTVGFTYAWVMLVRAWFGW